jgi:hypothetical protein
MSVTIALLVGTFLLASGYLSSKSLYDELLGVKGS